MAGLGWRLKVVGGWWWKVSVDSVVADDDASRADSCRDVAGIDPDRVWLRVV